MTVSANAPFHLSTIVVAEVDVRRAMVIVIALIGDRAIPAAQPSESASASSIG